MNDEAKRPSEVFRARLRYVRERAGLSQTELATRCADLGEPSYRQTTIAKLENGDRGVSLDDVFVLADALEVPPGWLMTPGGAGDQVILTATTTAFAATVRKWMVGHRVLVPWDEAEDLAKRGEVPLHPRLWSAVEPDEEAALNRWPLLHGLRQRVNKLLDGAFFFDSGTTEDAEKMLRLLDAVSRLIPPLREDLETGTGGED